MTSFTFPASLLARLGSLHHATDAHQGALAHINLQVHGDTAFIAATDGRLLAVVRTSVEDRDGDDTSVVLDVTAFTSACIAMARSDSASVVRCRVDLDAGEVRLTRGMASAIVRLHAMSYPPYLAAMERYLASPLVPSVGSFDSRLLLAATKIMGARTTTLMLWAPCSDPVLARCWDHGQPGDHLVLGTAVTDLMDRPGIWSDGSLLLLVMPITRSTSGAPDLTPFLVPVLELEPA